MIQSPALIPQSMQYWSASLPSSNICKDAQKLSESIKKLTGKDLDYHAIHLKAICTPNDHTAPSKHISDEKLCTY